MGKHQIVTFSGTDGAGKSTQIEAYQKYLEEKKIKHRVIWGRGGWTPGVELIKKLVRKDKGMTDEQKTVYREQIHANPKKEKLLLIGSILDLYLYFGIYYRFLKWTNKVLVCDRYIWDTMIDFKVIYPNIPFEKWIIWKWLLPFLPKPNRSIMLLINAEESERRCAEKEDKFPEPIERRLARVKLYHSYVENGKWTNVYDGMQSKDDIANRIIEDIGI